jgi:hypothetical protein
MQHFCGVWRDLVAGLYFFGYLWLVGFLTLAEFGLIARVHLTFWRINLVYTSS